MKRGKAYFAYGSNMDRIQMSHRCADARFAGVVMLPGCRFLINSRGVATVVEDPISTVHGILWDLTANDEVRLDYYEGVASGLYRKRAIAVIPVAGNGNAVSAMLYIAADQEPGQPRPGYLEKIIAAALGHRLPDVYVDGLKQWRVG